MNESKLDAICDTLKRADASPAMEAFRARQTERKRAAEVGASKAQALIDRAQKALKICKRIGRPPSNGWAANALHMAKMNKASYDLAINNISDQRRYDEWFYKGEKDYRDAEEAVRRLEEDAARGGY